MKTGQCHRNVVSPWRRCVVIGCLLQFEVKAIDSGVPQKEATKEVLLRVIHDEYAPEFVGEPYTIPTLPENKPVGHRVFQLSGRDKDQKVGISVFVHLHCTTGNVIRN